MKNIIKKGLVSITMSMMLLVAIPTSTINANNKLNLHNHAKAVAAMNLNTGHFLYTKNANKRYAIASTTKLMTLYLTINKINHERNGWNHRVRISNNLSKMSKSPDLGNVRLVSGRKYTVRTLYRASLIASSNPSAITLGKWVGGSNHHFINMMNAQAKQWHINHQAHFVSSSGLENNDLYRYGIRYGKYHDYNRVSARAITTIASHLLKLYPNIVNDAKHRFEYMGHQKMKNENELLKGGYNYQPSLHVDGLKTGYTPLAGYCLVSTSKLPNHNHLIVTTLNDRQGSYDQARLIHKIQSNILKGQN
ncbi:D-alanyl-D-alanine carboxypeptidase [Apilactobacillus timberlakei]|uniref:D-alanyl-D-alanine carboxypeptidase family protein n=1 Tax=Apilactobacillus timberlakei TaxID=2008380 RepID=UPI00112CB535|nr:serine hydrolase [Apilactobacillus timberlakei]TPR18027.1 D-alanyl-D-alanine carboxypeptidase [Apilactobacillus timberlakei]TPR19829.1 D-alanyl-D-alanine carboxypeptidase [Apilactobacillus timberlakei]TPR21367.1 D-alanyl-D-alanine carboxypeptidase [Apilactobacillus timberlakei]TPR23403.1 D-alanyl-D-alanine carboxypeptidase [Apilactobacillus timberlakei]